MTRLTGATPAPAIMRGCPGCWMLSKPGDQTRGDALRPCYWQRRALPFRSDAGAPEPDSAARGDALRRHESRDALRPTRQTPPLHSNAGAQERDRNE